MTSLRRAPVRGLLALVLAALTAGLMVVSLVGAPAQAAPDRPAGAPAPATAPGDDDLTNEQVAEQALETVEAAIAPGEPDTAAQPDPAAHQEFTSALRDLSSLQDYLSPAKQKVAQRLLARPTDPVSTCSDSDYACFGSAPVQKLCNALICVHYTKTGPHRVPGDNNGPGGSWNGTAGGAPDYVEFTLATMTTVAKRYVNAGYRPVVSDEGADGTAQTDIYVADIGGGAFPLYGYCWTNDAENAHVTVAPYCVLDNDYKSSQFPTHTPQGNLRVTAAHEFFHAVQFAYDFYEDAWFFESTATWAEDIFYDTVNDNRQYLPYGPLGRPAKSLDLWSGLTPYASWIFMQFLGQRFPASQGDMPVIIREIWEKLSHTGTGAESMYSVQAISSALEARGTDLTTEFAKFTAWNRRPRSFYAEGAAYRPAGLSSSYRISPSDTAKRVRFSLDHLSARHYRFTSDFRGSKRLEIKVNLNDREAGGFAYVLFKPRGEGARLRVIPLNAAGNATVTYPFGSSVDWIEVDAVNASARYTACDTAPADERPYYTCGGRPVDDRMAQAITVRAVNP
ncbi:MXAN_6640 family putative metalloprotease [Nocardioides caeni]|uniref:Uncharacterized protein n=1 Tax=Nocardioides caeni TaxID=574700 RepID=A0A4V4HKJ9_9ACTN|nr:MXAN_6640 family putative metalloprotease [Nocardioides caeni]THV14646.1 hypothetical protein E9934_08260 [Nocardioides caeni]